MQATQSTTEKQLSKTGTNLASSIAAVATMEQELKAAGEKFAFLQDTRAYIADLCDMLQVCRQGFFLCVGLCIWQVRRIPGCMHAGSVH